MTALSLRGELIRVAYEHEGVRALVLPILTSRVASSEVSLKARAIRLAYAHPELRGLVLPCIKVADTRKRMNQQRKKNQQRSERAKKRDADIAENNAARDATSAGEGLVEALGKGYKVPWKHGRRGEITLKTLISYAGDKNHPKRQEAQKLVEQLRKKQRNDRIKGAIKNTSKKVLAGASRLLAEGVKAGLGAASELSDGIGNMILSASKTPGEIMSEAVGKISEQLDKDRAKNESHYKEAFKSIGTQDFESASTMMMAGKRMGLGVMKTAGAKIGSAGVGALKGAGQATMGVATSGALWIAGGAFKALGGGLKVLQKGAEAADRVKLASDVDATVDELLNNISEYLGEIGPNELEALEPYIQDDGNFDVEAFNKDLEEQGAEAIKALEEYLSEVVEDEGESEEETEEEGVSDEAEETEVEETEVEETEAEETEEEPEVEEAEVEGEPEAEEESEEEESEEEESEEETEEEEEEPEAEGVSDEAKAKANEAIQKALSKKALVRVAYENPKYRPVLLDLIKDGRNRYPASEIRSVLMGAI